MKRLIILLLPVLFSMGVVAQGNKPVKEKNKSVKVKNSEGEKGKKEKQDELEKGNRSHDDIIWEGTSKPGGKGPKFSKNQPAKVRAAFQRDYPGATNVRWSKYRGDWTATFGNGISLQPLSTMLMVTEEIQGLLSYEEICPLKLKTFLRRSLQHSSVIL